MCIWINTAHNNKELIKLGFSAIVVLVFIPKYLVKAVKDDISTNTVPIWLHHTVEEFLLEEEDSASLV